LGPAAVEVDKVLGSLPVIADFCRRLDIRGIVDRAVPVRDIALCTHGQVIEALVANRLTSPRPLVHVEQWAAEWAAEEVFGVSAETLNDDRIGRALDAVAPALAGIIGSVGAQAINSFGLDVSRLHWDMTSMSLYGDYDNLTDGFAEPGYGHSKNRRPDLKQIQTGLAVTGDGGIPIFHKAFDGKAGEVNQVVGAMESLRDMCSERKFLLVGDSKLVSYTNLNALITAGLTFIAPAAKLYVTTEELAAAGRRRSKPVDYLAERDAAKPADQRGTYRVVEDRWTMHPPTKVKGSALALRRVFVFSSADADATTKTRANKLARATDDLNSVTRGLGGRHYPNPDAVSARVTAIAAKRRVGDYLRTTIGTDTSGKPTLDWQFDKKALAAEGASDGWYCLLTNLAATDATSAEVLARYKGQEVVERRYGAFKGPLAVAPVFLKNNRRIEALLSVICLALLIFCLVERQLRQAIAPDIKMADLGVYRDAKPTGRLIFEALSRLRLIPGTANSPPIIPAPPDLPARILTLLNIKPTTIR
jgi:transposase